MRQPFLLSTLVALLICAPPTHAAPLTNPLTTDQVTCDELQLERLALRTGIVQASVDFAHPSLLLWHSGLGGGGGYAGLAVTDGISGGSGHLVRSEEQLALDLVTVDAGDFLNPARRLLPRATIVRRDQDSNLVAHGQLSVTMALEAITMDPFFPLIPIAINNLSAGNPAAAPGASANGRGITVDSLTSSCENLLTPFDQRIFTILSRTVRVSQCAFSSCNPDGSAYNMTLFRGADPQTYRANVYWYGDSCDSVCTATVINKVAYEFKMNWDATGKLTMGEVTVLPSCTNSPIQCDDGGGYPLFVLPPLWAGHGHQGQHFFDLGARVGNDSPQRPLRPTATIDWQALLANSAWN